MSNNWFCLWNWAVYISVTATIRICWYTLVNVNHHGGHVFEIAMFSVIPKEPILVVLTQTGNKRRVQVKLFETQHFNLCLVFLFFNFLRTLLTGIRKGSLPLILLCLVILYLSRRDSLQTYAFNGSRTILHLSILQSSRESFIKDLSGMCVRLTSLTFSVFPFSLTTKIVNEAQPSWLSLEAKTTASSLIVLV